MVPDRTWRFRKLRRQVRSHSGEGLERKNAGEERTPSGVATSHCALNPRRVRHQQSLPEHPSLSNYPEASRRPSGGNRVRSALRPWWDRGDAAAGWSPSPLSLVYWAKRCTERQHYIPRRSTERACSDRSKPVNLTPFHRIRTPATPVRCAGMGRRFNVLQHPNKTV